MWILLKQETVSGSGISWAICKSARCSRQITTPEPHRSVFYRPDALPAARPTASKHRRPLQQATSQGFTPHLTQMTINISPYRRIGRYWRSQPTKSMTSLFLKTGCRQPLRQLTLTQAVIFTIFAQTMCRSQRK